MAKPGRQIKEPAIKSGPYRIAPRNGAFILYHGNSVRQVFKTKAEAEQYLGWILGDKVLAR